jgi:hypothetical protein
MLKPALVQKLVYYVLLFVTFVGTAGWSLYWVMFRVPIADWRYLAVGLLLAAVLGWWPVISVAAFAVLAAALGFIPSDLDSYTKIQVVEDLAVFWALGLGWGVLAKHWLAAPPVRQLKEVPVPTRRPGVGKAAGAPPALRPAQDEAFRSTRLMSGAFDESIRKPGGSSDRPLPSRDRDEDLGPREFPVFQEPPKPAGPLPRPVLPPPPSYFGGESVYTPSLPGLGSQDVSHVPLGPDTPEPPPPPPGLGLGARLFSNAPPPPPTPPRHGPRLESHPPRPPTLDEPSVVPIEEFPTMELPVNTLLRAASHSSHSSSSSHQVPPSTPGSAAGSSSDGSDSDLLGGRRSSNLLRPETVPGTPYEHLLEWFNQFSWSPWTAEELQRRYYLPGAHVVWESLALADLAKAWKLWKAGPSPMATSPGQVSLGALEGFLRCEFLGVLRQKGFADLNTLSTSTAGDAWTTVYHEVRGRMRGGNAVIHRVDQGEPATDVNGVLVGRPDRLAEVRKESDVVALVTPFAVGESLNWTNVYAVAQLRVAENMGWVLSGVPVVINLPLPIWDERRLSRVIVVDDVATERRRLDIALERFNKILSNLLAPKPQTQAAVCNGCGGRHHCPHYAGTRPRLDLANPPPQIAAALR